MNLLIVDDHPTNLKLLRAQLEAEGHAVFEAHDGVDALALLNRQQVDAVISDILMPRMDGYRLCHEIRKHARLRDLPIIIYSSTYTSPEDEKLALEMGADKYIKKPASVATLVAALHEVVAQPHAAPRPDARREVEVLKNYNERLVSKLKEKNTELQAQTEALRLPSAALTAAANAILIANRDGTIVWVNPAYTALTGYTLAEAVGKNARDLVKSGQQERAVYEEMWATILAGRIWHGQIVNRRKDGSLYPEEQTITPVRDANGEITHFIAIKQDLSERKHAEEALRQSEERYRLLFERSPDTIFAITPTATIASLNHAFETLTGWPLVQWLGRSYQELIHPDDQTRAGELFQLLLRGERTPPFELRVRTAAGGFRAVEFTGFSSELSGGRIEVQGIGRDITERKAAERMIVHLNRVYAMLSGINTLIVRVRDRDELFREACRIAVEAGGFRMAVIAIVDRSAMKIVPVASASKDEVLLTAVKGVLSSSEDAPNTMLARAIREKKAVVSNDSQSDPKVLFGKKYAESGVRSMAVFPLIVADEAVGVLALYASEIEFFHEEEMKLLTELAGDIAFALDHIEKQERLDYLAYYDVLTGLANRSLFLDRVAQYTRSAISGGHKLALFVIDLERFKNINDSLGRTAGDALLRQVAQWLTHNAGNANLVARVGADHFAAVLPEVKQEGDVVRLLEKTMAAFLEHPFRLDDAVFRIASKIGVAVFPDDGADAETLFKNAEAALKKAKASGDRYLFYTQKMTETVAGKLTLENQLRQALDNREFVLHYQPKVNLSSGKLTGAEALIRWNDPRTGLVPPGRFIPVLEEIGLIHDVGRWALRQALADYLRWRSAGLPAVRIAVNVSPLQLRSRGFVAEIQQAIGVDPHAPAGLELEITESVIMEDVKHSIVILTAIRAMGVTIAIDDFGTGFSSLSYLAKLPVDTLKIDRSFVVDMTVGPQGLALVSTIINLAHSLRLKVVAEGVETDEQARLLRLLACDEMQGFLFSKPVPGDAFEAAFLGPVSEAAGA